MLISLAGRGGKQRTCWNAIQMCSDINLSQMIIVIKPLYLSNEDANMQFVKVFNPSESCRLCH